MTEAEIIAALAADPDGTTPLGRLAETSSTVDAICSRRRELSTAKLLQLREFAYRAHNQAATALLDRLLADRKKDTR